MTTGIEALLQNASATVMPLESGIVDAFGLVSSGDAFDRTFETTISQATPVVNDIQSKLATLPAQINGVEASLIQNANSIVNQVTASVARLPAFAAHVTDQFNNLMGNISTFASSQGLSNALAGNKAGGCGDLKNFFGSITTEGPRLIGAVTGIANEIKGEIDSFKQLGLDLQGQITSTKTALLSGLQAQISQTVNTSALANLNSIMTNITNNFQSGIADTRANLAKQAMSLLPANSIGSIQGLVSDMRNTDFSIFSSSQSISAKAAQIDAHTTALQQMVLGEKSALTGAVSHLEQLGAVSSMKSLLGTNPCVQTLMGFVGKPAFLKSLGG